MTALYITSSFVAHWVAMPEMASRIRAIFAENLYRLRTEREISQEKLALKAGVERAYIGRIERQGSSPTIDVVEKIARALKVPPDELLRSSSDTRRR